MKPPFEITNQILKLITTISEKIGQIHAHHLERPSPELRKKNRIKTIKASLEIEGNTLSEDQITAIIENKKIIGPKKDIREVVNAIEVYEKLPQLDPFSLKSFLKAHQLLMQELIETPGKWRTSGVGIFKGEQVSHVAPPTDRLDHLMSELFNYLKGSDDPVLIKSCVLHYEIEFIHPFMDGNGRMGRLWQTLILMKSYPVFEFLPFETIISDRKDEYYNALEISDMEGKSTAFIEFILTAIDESFNELLEVQTRLNSSQDRIDYFINIFTGKSFSRKDYMRIFKDISPATASRDLQYGVENHFLNRDGHKRTTVYQIKKVK